MNFSIVGKEISLIVPTFQNVMRMDSCKWECVMILDCDDKLKEICHVEEEASKKGEREGVGRPLLHIWDGPTGVPCAARSVEP